MAETNHQAVVFLFCICHAHLRSSGASLLSPYYILSILLSSCSFPFISLAGISGEKLVGFSRTLIYRNLGLRLAGVYHISGLLWAFCLGSTSLMFTALIPVALYVFDGMPEPELTKFSMCYPIAKSQRTGRIAVPESIRKEFVGRADAFTQP